MKVKVMVYSLVETEYTFDSEDLGLELNESFTKGDVLTAYDNLDNAFEYETSESIVDVQSRNVIMGE